MSFGFGVGDFLQVLNLCREVHGKLKGAPAEYRECQSELNSVTTAIVSLVKAADDPRSMLSRQGAHRKEDLILIVNNCRAPLEKLEALVNHYSRIVDSGEGKLVRVWDTFRFGMSDLESIRSKLNFHLLTINAFMTSLESFSMGSMERKLDKIYAMLKSSAINGDSVDLMSSRASIMSSRSSVILSEIHTQGTDAWEGLREALLAEDISLLQIDAHRDEIFHYVKSLLSQDPSLEAAIAISGLSQPVPNFSLPPLIEVPTMSEPEPEAIREDSCMHGLGIEVMKEVTSVSAEPWDNNLNLRPVVSERAISETSYQSTLDEAFGLTSPDPNIPQLAFPPTSETLSPSDPQVQPMHDFTPLIPRTSYVREVVPISNPLKRTRSPSPVESTAYSPSVTSGTSSIFDASTAFSSMATTPMTSTSTSRSPTLKPPSSRASTVMSSASKESTATLKSISSDTSSKMGKKFSSFAKSLLPKPGSTSIYDNPFSGAY